jgi:hypothetical protein
MSGVPNRGHGSRSRKRGGHGVTDSSTPPSAPPVNRVGPVPKIYWDTEKTSARTSRLIEWCKINTDARLKIFSDSAKDAKEEGRTRQQMSKQKSTYYQQLAAAVFENDEDTKVRDYFQANPLAFVKPIQNRFTT